MLKPEFREFERLCTEGNLIPVYAELLADLETPVGVLKRFAGDENVFLLESVEGGERFGRYSFIGVNPYGLFSIEEGVPYYAPAGGQKVRLPCKDTPLDALRSLVAGVKAVPTSRRCSAEPSDSSGMRPSTVSRNFRLRKASRAPAKACSCSRTR